MTTNCEGEKSFLNPVVEFHRLSIDPEKYAQTISKREPLITEEVLPELIDALHRLQSKLSEPVKSKFYYYRALRTHLLPLTNVAFDKSGGKCVTGSYDRTARVWSVEDGIEIHVLDGHQNAVFAVDYNYPKWFVIIIWTKIE